MCDELLQTVHHMYLAGWPEEAETTSKGLCSCLKGVFRNKLCFSKAKSGSSLKHTAIGSRLGIFGPRFCLQNMILYHDSLVTAVKSSQVLFQLQPKNGSSIIASLQLAPVVYFFV